MNQFTVGLNLYDVQIGTVLNKSNRYKNKKYEISCVAPCFATHNFYEIFCIKGNLFKGTERFFSLLEAEARINELLNKKINKSK